MQLKLNIAIVLLAALCVALLYLEGRRARRNRSKIGHVIHVNGTRGKSTVCRLIDAGLRAGGMRVFTKTTGTDPMTIDCTGAEAPLPRRGRANIKEQLFMLRRAADAGADALVLECMAVRPELQRMSERMLEADIALITNVRRDHTDVMGETNEEIADSLCNMLPPGGTLFTAETRLLPRITEHASRIGCRTVAVAPGDDLPAFEFADNLALALAVCTHLGVSRETALAGMRAFRPDPYSLVSYRLGEAVFINGLSANDPESTLAAFSRECGRLALDPVRLILIVNNRADRGARTEDMIGVCAALHPDRVALLGAAQGYFARQLRKRGLRVPVQRFRRAKDVPFADWTRGTVVFAFGNIAQGGRELIRRVREEGVPIV